MTRFLYPRAAGQGQVVLGGVVFTDGAAEADLGPHMSTYLEMIGALPVRSAEELDEHTVDELREIASAAGLHLASHLHKADMISALRGESAVDHKAEAKGSEIVDVEPAGDAKSDSTGDESTPTEIAPQPVAPDLPGDDEHHEEGTSWQPSPPSTTSSTTSGSLSLQARRRQQS